MGGVNKALLPWGDGTLIDRQIQIAAQWAEEIIVVSNDTALSARLSANMPIQVVPDLFIGEGPLAGLHAGLKAAQYERIWLLACDQPFVSVEAALLLSERMDSDGYQAVLPVIGRRLQPLHGLYRKALADRVQAFLQSGERKLVSFLDGIKWCGVEEQTFIDRGIPLHFTDDVDTREQYTKAKERTRMQHDPNPERFQRHALQPENAQNLILEHVQPLPTERVQLLEAWGRRLAEPVAAPHPFPPFRRSGMDGYAVRTEDLNNAASDSPALLEVVESLPAGVAPRAPIGPGQACRIMTGGMVPEGADAVVMLEMTKTEEQAGKSYVLVSKRLPIGLNISEVGSEMEAGAPLLAAGQLIGTGETALLAACGYATVTVTRRPRVGVLSTGSELLEVDEPLEPAKIRNSNAPMLAAMLREAGMEPVMLGKVPDEIQAAQALVRQGLQDCDLLLTTGGVSVGDYDVMVDVLADWDGRLLFNKVAMRPGSPTTAAVLDGKLLIALSGNPGACFVGFNLFVLPALKAMQRVSNPYARSFTARLGAEFPKVNAFRRYIRGSSDIREGMVWVTPTGEDKSSLMTTIVGADCLIEIPPLKETLEQGELVRAWRLE